MAPTCSSHRQTQTAERRQQIICATLAMTPKINGVRRILVRGSMPPCRLRRRKFWKFAEGYSRRRVMVNNNNNNNHHQLDQPFITRITSPHPYSENCSFCMFTLFNFSSIFPGGQLTPFAPMCGRPCLKYRAMAILTLCRDVGIHEARDPAQNRPLWRLMSLHSATHS